MRANANAPDEPDNETDDAIMAEATAIGARMRDMTCPDCGTQYSMGSALPPGARFCTCPGALERERRAARAAINPASP